jgi:hypothetical protein
MQFLHRHSSSQPTHSATRATPRTNRPMSRMIVAAVAAGAVTIGSLAASALPAAAAESNERLPRVPVTVEQPAETGLLPWTTRAANDMRGYRASTYTGKYYDQRFEQYRLCVVQRESGGYYDESSPSFVGAYQFGGPYNSPSSVASRLRAEFGDRYGQDALREIDKLASSPIYTWNRFWQDAAFWTTFNRGAGWRQWSSEWGANWHCDHRPNAENGWPSRSRYHYTPIERGGLNKVARQYRTDVSTRARGEAVVREKYGKAPAAMGTPRYSKWLARKVIKDDYGWGRGHFKALKKMWFKESNWRYEVVNWQGPWYGLGQVNGPYINSRGYSIDAYRASPYVQILVGAAYIDGRYGDPKAAWKDWQIKGWY